MIALKRLFLFSCIAALLLSACNSSLTSYVNPFVGTDGHGHTYPGAIVPFGMIQPSPDTRQDGWDGCSGYHYSDDTVYGFSHTHLSGTGCLDYGDVLVMPFADQPIDEGFGTEQWRESYKSKFSHRSEKAHPGYYSVILDKNCVMVELSALQRVAFHRYSYPHNGEKGFLIDLHHRDKLLEGRIELIESDGRQMIVGHRVSESWNPSQKVFFAITADQPITSVKFNADSTQAIVYLSKNKKLAELKVAISAVDSKGAIANLATEEDMNFAQAKKQSNQIWEQELGKIEIQSKDRSVRKNFYTSLYHCFTSPYLYSDVDGRYRGTDDSIHCDTAHNVYTVFSLWDTYRTLHPLLTLIDRERTADFVNTFLHHFEQGGELTMWELSANETHCMIGYHSAPVLLDALNAGILDADKGSDSLSLWSMPAVRLLKGLLVTSNRTEGMQHYAHDGYLSSEFDNESVSKTLEYSYDDWCIAQYADKLKSLDPGNSVFAGYCDSVYRVYTRRAQSYRNLIDADGFMHPKRNGGFVDPFDPTEVNNHFTEANSWQYSTYVPHDLKRFVALHGGAKKFDVWLDSLFHSSSQMSGREQSDITGLIGQYAHGNEPSHHAAYLYNYIGKAWKTQELVRQICTELYTPKPDGLCGNEDCGQMSAWYVMSALGLYPVCPGFAEGDYTVGSPLVDKAVIHLENGNDITISCTNQSRNSCYVQGIELNGAPFNSLSVSRSQLAQGADLQFRMGAKPAKDWSASAEIAVPSFDDAKYLITPQPYFGNWQQRFTGTELVEIHNPQGALKNAIYYTVNGGDPDTNATLYEGPISIDFDAVIRAVAYSAQTGYSKVVEHKMTRLVSDRKLTYKTRPEPQYEDAGEVGLIDGIRGSANYRIGGWQGWTKDMDVVVDLLSERTIFQVSVGCLEDIRSWIMFPSGIDISTSLDGKTYIPYATVDNPFYPATKAMQEAGARTFDFAAQKSVTTRFVRIKAHNYGPLPKWHVSAGCQAWLFVDEINISCGISEPSVPANN